MPDVAGIGVARPTKSSATDKAKILKVISTCKSRNSVTLALQAAFHGWPLSGHDGHLLDQISRNINHGPSCFAGSDPTDMDSVCAVMTYHGLQLLSHRDPCVHLMSPCSGKYSCITLGSQGLAAAGKQQHTSVDGLRTRHGNSNYSSERLRSNGGETSR